MLFVILPIVMAASPIESPVHVIDITAGVSSSLDVMHAGIHESPAHHVIVDVAPETTAIKEGQKSPVTIGAQSKTSAVAEIELTSKINPLRKQRNLIQVLSNSEKPVNFPKVFEPCYRIIADFLGSEEILRIVLRHLKAPYRLLGPQLATFRNENRRKLHKIVKATGLAFLDLGRLYRFNAGNREAIRMIKSLGETHLRATKSSQLPLVQVERGEVRGPVGMPCELKCAIASTCLSITFVVVTGIVVFAIRASRGAYSFHGSQAVLAIVNATGRF